MSMYDLYRKHWGAGEPGEGTCPLPDGCTVRILRPGLRGVALPSERITRKQSLLRWYFWLITRGRYHIHFLCLDGRVIHSAFVIPRCSKFPFLGEGDFEIGPCHTDPAYRRKGCYQFMLAAVTSHPMYRDAGFYMIVSPNNRASVRGIEKADFEKLGVVRKKGLKYSLAEE